MFRVTTLVILCSILLAQSCVTLAQDLSPGIISVAYYDTCEQSPLDNDTCANNPSFDDPDPTNSGATGVTVVRVRVVANQIRGVDTLEFSVDNIVPDGVDSSTDLNCDSLPEGTDCAAFQNKLFISIASSPLFAQYDLTQRDRRISYAMQNEYVYVADDDGDNESRDAYTTWFGGSESGSGRYGATGAIYEPNPTCSSKDDQNQNLRFGNSSEFDDRVFVSGQRGTGVSATLLCPDTVDLTLSNYYTPPQISEQDASCPTVACSVPKNGKPPTEDNPDPKTSMWMFQPRAFAPYCRVYDIRPRARAAMDITINAAFGTSNNTLGDPLTLSTTNGAALVGGARINDENRLFAQIAAIDTTSGIVGPYLDGLIVTCDPDQDLTTTGQIDDLATPPSTVNVPSLFNPWRAYDLSLTSTGANRCPLPSAGCRQQFHGKPRNAFWYYANAENKKDYGSATTCNANGADETIYSNPTNAQYLCAEVSKAWEDLNSEGGGADNGVPTLGFAASTCIPGSEQPGVSTDSFFNKDQVVTPCVASYKFAETIASLDASSNENKFYNVPSDYRITSPQYMLQGDRLLRDSTGGSTDSVAVEIDLYVAGRLLGDITQVTRASFVSEGMICDGANGQSGQIAYTLKNDGTTPGAVLVTAAFSFTDEASSDAEIQIEGAGPATVTLQTNVLDDLPCPASGNCVVQQTTQVPIKGFADGQFTYVYTGSIGKPMVVRLVLSTPDGKNVFSFQDLSCNIILGTSVSQNVLNIPAVVEEVDPPRPCAWWNVLRPQCVSEVRFFHGKVIMIFLILLVIAYAIAIIVIECIGLVWVIRSTVAVGSTASADAKEMRARKE